VSPIPEPKCLGTGGAEYEWILAEYRAARHPASAPESVKPLDLPSGWEARLDKLREFYATG
jgi:hypothetical protein